MKPADATQRLSRQEMLILKALAAKQSVPVSSTQRLRLELLGLVRDGPKGLAITPLGARLAAAWRDTAANDDHRGRVLEAVERDLKGRRLPNRRFAKL